MTKREIDLEEIIMEYSMQMIKEQKQQIEKILEIYEKDISKDVLLTFHQLFRQAKGDGGDKEGKEVSYVVISFLNIGILRESIELKIDLYDGNILFDKKPVTIYYNFRFFDELISKDIKDFQKYIETKMIRVKYHELWRYRKVCMIKYKSIMEECLQAYVEMIVRLKSFLELKKTQDFKIVYGELMCKNTILYEFERN